MRKLAGLWALGSGLWGCHPAVDCSRNPGHEECFERRDVGPDNIVLADAGPDGGLGAYLSYQNLGLVDENLCGWFHQRVLWTFPGRGAPDDGWIIQKISVTSDHFSVAQAPHETQTACVAGGALNQTYWEAWKVNFGEEKVTYRGGVDRWEVTPVNVGETTFTFRGEAIFRPGDLPVAFQTPDVHGDRELMAWTNGLPATRDWSADWATIPENTKLIRSITVDVTCCPHNETAFENSHANQ